jgi:hypothetical protein
MQPRSLVVTLAASLVLWHASQAWTAEVQMHKGTVVSAANGRLVMKDMAGREHTHLVSKDTKVTIHGQPGRLEQLEPTMLVRVATEGADKVVSVSTVDDDKRAPAAD